MSVTPTTHFKAPSLCKYFLYYPYLVCSGIPGMCDFKSVHGGKKELFHFLWLLMQKCGLKLIVFEVSSPVNSLFRTILIEWMFPQDGQRLVDGVRHHFWLSYSIFSENKQWNLSNCSERGKLGFLLHIESEDLLLILRFWVLSHFPATSKLAWLCPVWGYKVKYYALFYLTGSLFSWLSVTLCFDWMYCVSC